MAGKLSFRIAAYWSTLVLSVLFVLASILILLAAFIDIWGHMHKFASFPWDRLVPIFTVLLTAVGTFSAVFFGWRIDRRHADELELKLKEFESKQAASNVDKKV